MKIMFKLKSELGEFTSEEMMVTEEQYKNLVEMARQFYNGGYDMWLPNGFLVVPPDVVKRSILIIEIINDDSNNE
jgi:hypothetical protein